jgi:hypothetical protein
MAVRQLLQTLSGSWRPGGDPRALQVSQLHAACMRPLMPAHGLPKVTIDGVYACRAGSLLHGLMQLPAASN